jgi:hypothetical protein
MRDKQHKVVSAATEYLAAGALDSSFTPSTSTTTATGRRLIIQLKQTHKFLKGFARKCRGVIVAVTIATQ